MNRKENLIWIDLEMTGLNPDKDRIIEIATVVTDKDLHRHLLQAAPMMAGLDIQATSGLRSLPLSPWAGLGVMAAWAAGALLAGGLLLRFRDA